LHGKTEGESFVGAQYPEVGIGSLPPYQQFLGPLQSFWKPRETSSHFKAAHRLVALDLRHRRRAEG